MKRVFRLFPPRRRNAKEKQIAECYTRSPDGHIVVRLRLSSPTDLTPPTAIPLTPCKKLPPACD